jgi:hypothetical protein
VERSGLPPTLHAVDVEIRPVQFLFHSMERIIPDDALRAKVDQPPPLCRLRAALHVQIVRRPVVADDGDRGAK